MMVSPELSNSATALIVCSVGSPEGTMTHTARGAESRPTMSSRELEATAPASAAALTASWLKSKATTL